MLHRRALCVSSGRRSPRTLWPFLPCARRRHVGALPLRVRPDRHRRRASRGNDLGHLRARRAPGRDPIRGAGVVRIVHGHVVPMVLRRRILARLRALFDFNVRF